MSERVVLQTFNISDLNEWIGDGWAAINDFEVAWDNVADELVLTADVEFFEDA